MELERKNSLPLPPEQPNPFQRLLKNPLLPLKWIYQLIGFYYLLHMSIFIFVLLNAAWLFYLIDFAGFTDSLFTVVSAMTCTGLITVDTHALNFAAQFLIWWLIWTGSFIFHSFFPLMIRAFRFRKAISEGAGRAPEAAIEQLRIQYHAIIVLFIVSVLYFASIQVFTSVFMIIYSYLDDDVLAIYNENNVNFAWGSIFLTISGFNNAGFSLFSQNMIQFQSEWVPLTVFGIMILLGNTDLSTEPCFSIT